MKCAPRAAASRTPASLAAMCASIPMERLGPPQEIAELVGAGKPWTLDSVDFSDPNLVILMRHRAVLFGLLGAFLVVAAFRPALQPMGFFAGLASVLAFLLIAASTGNYNDAVAGIVTGDIVALLALAVGLATRAFIRNRNAGRGP